MRCQTRSVESWTPQLIMVYSRYVPMQCYCTVCYCTVPYTLACIFGISESTPHSCSVEHKKVRGRGSGESPPPSPLVLDSPRSLQVALNPQPSAALETRWPSGPPLCSRCSESCAPPELVVFHMQQRKRLTGNDRLCYWNA